MRNRVLMAVFMLAVLVGLCSCAPAAESVFNTEHRMLYDAIVAAEKTLEPGETSDIIEAARAVLNDPDADYTDIMEAISSLSLFSAVRSDRDIVFVDRAVEKRVKALLGKSASQTVSREEAAGVTELDLSFSADDPSTADRVVYTDDLKWFTSLKKLNLSGNALRDLSGLAGLTALEELDLSHNFDDASSFNEKLFDLSALRALKSLSVLDLAGNGIRDVSALSVVTSLTVLDLSDNNVSSLAPLATLSRLTTVYLDGMSVKDVSPFYALADLRVVSLCRCTISSSGGIENLGQISELYLAGSKGMSTADISALASLEILDISNSGTSKLSFASRLENLRRLDISHNKITELSSLFDLPALETLNASYNQIKSVSVPEGVLVSLDLSHNKLTSLSFAQNDTLLTLDVSYNKLKSLDITPLASLDTLDASCNSLSDVSRVSCPTLTVLNLYDNSFSSYNAKNPALLTLSLEYNPVSSITGVLSSPHLKALNLNDTYVKKLTSLTLLEELEELTVDVAVEKNNISTLSSFKRVKKLVVYEFYGNNWDLFLPLAETLESLTVCSEQVTVPQLSGMTALRELVFKDCTMLTDLSHLTDLPALETLTVQNADLSEPNVCGLDALKTLELVSCGVDKVSFLYDLPSLERLDLSQNDVDEFVFSSFPKLSYLSLRKNGIKSLSGFSAGIDGGYLDLSENDVKSLEPLNVLSSLSVLDVRGNGRISSAEELENVDIAVFLCD